MDQDKVFLLMRGDLENRLDPFYYIPSLVLLEKKVLKKQPYKLRHYINSIASGATPSVVELEKYYSDASNGYPFIRVQNLSETGELSLDDVKYINKETHNGYLKRSRVNENDLLIKITGVGRMAIASIPPKGFEGNINQHSVVIKTDDRQTSKILAAFLNSDIGERLASKRATGGTRPALDYSALKSIPIIFDNEIFNLFEKATKQKAHKENEAQILFDSVDSYLFDALGIKIPAAPENNIKNRIFNIDKRSVTGNRFDPFYNQEYFARINEAIKKGKLQWSFLKDLTSKGLIKGYLPNAEEKEGPNKVIQINSINSDGSINLKNLLTAKDVFFRSQQLEKNDILIVITGATIGKVGIWDYDGEYFLGGDIVKVQITPKIDPYYIFSYLRSKPVQIEIKRNVTGATNGHLSPFDIGRLIVPVPSNKREYDLIESISKHVRETREKAFNLKNQALKEFETAKKEIDKLILD